jgi:phenylacetate-CoA ligase
MRTRAAPAATTGVWRGVVHDALWAPRRTTPSRVRLLSCREAELWAPADLADRPLDLPLLFHWGRSDSTVAFYGANIGPADLEEVAYSLPELAGRVDSFALAPWEDEHANKRLRIAFELAQGVDPPDADSVYAAVLDRLRAVNQDYREAARFIPASAEPTVEFHPRGTGPFAGYDVRLKRRYVLDA